MKYRILFLLLVSTFLLASETFAQGCSQCKMMSEQATMDEASFGSNINYGILYLMLIPYALLLFLFRKKIKKVFQLVFKR